MAWAHIQDTSKFESSSSTSHSLAYTTAPTTGNLLVTATIGGLPTYSAVADTYGNTWTSVGTYSPTDLTGKMQIWACVNKGGSGTDTFSFTSAPTEQLEIFVAEFSGALSPLTQDGSVATNQGTTGTAIALGTPFAPSASGDLLIFMAQAANNVNTINSPFTQMSITSNGDGWGYLFDSGTTSEAGSATGASTGAWACVMVGIEAATGGSPTGFELGVTPALRPQCMPKGV